MNLPQWSDIDFKVDSGEDLTPLERFIYDSEDPTYGEKWREQFVAAIRHITRLPKSCGECPISKGCGMEIDYKKDECKARYFDYINQ
jgi:hypothetical protein